MDTEQREAVLCVLDALAEGIEELRALLLDDGKPAPTVQPGMRALTPDGDVFYITSINPDGVRCVGEHWRPGRQPVVLHEFMVPEQEALPTPCVGSEGGLYRVLTPDGWGTAYYRDVRGWSAVGWTKDFAMQYRDTRNKSCRIIRAFPLQDA